MGRPTHSIEMLLPTQVSLEPFEKWGINFFGHIDPLSKGKHYILVCTNYVTKWVETKALPTTKEERVVDILYKKNL